MKKIKEYLRVSILLMVCTFLAGSLLNSCEKEPEENPDNSAFENNYILTDITNEALYNWEGYDLYFPSDTLLLVNSNSELQAIFGNLANFDFTNKSLLICGGGTNAGISDMTAILNTVKPDSYELNIRILKNIACVAENWIKVFSTSSKMNSDVSITLEVDVYEVDERNEFYSD